jgi:hypothetical protein
MRFLRALRRLTRLRSLDCGDYAVSVHRPEGNVDAEAAAAAQNIASAISHSAGPLYPPGYVKDYDEGRPRR